MADALAVTTIQNIPPDRYERIQQAVEEKLGTTLTGNSGTADGEHGAKLGFKYNGSSLLTIWVIAPPKELGLELMSPQAVISKVETAINAIS